MNREELLKIAKPIPFNTEMVQAILDGRKTVTRRVVKNIHPQHNGQWGYTVFTPDNHISFRRSGAAKEWFFKLPYAKGDVLYVREKFNDIETDTILYAADKDFIDYGYKEVDGYLFRESEVKWKPSIHMPKEAARIFLKVTNVRVERLRDIDKLWSNYDKEGMRNPATENISIAMQERFIDVWNSTIKKQDIDKYSWDANPWVWVIEFKRVEAEE